MYGLTSGATDGKLLASSWYKLSHYVTSRAHLCCYVWCDWLWCVVWVVSLPITLNIPMHQQWMYNCIASTIQHHKTARRFWQYFRSTITTQPGIIPKDTTYRWVLPVVGYGSSHGDINAWLNHNPCRTDHHLQLWQKCTQIYFCKLLNLLQYQF